MNYTELVAASKAYADRQDIEVNANIDVFLIMTEARINRLLKTRKQSTRAASVVNEAYGYYTLPPDYAGLRYIRLNIGTTDVSYQQVKYSSPEAFDYAISSGSDTLIYTIVGDQLRIHPKQTGDIDIEIAYYQKVPPLGITRETNWLIEDHPDIYLSGMVAEIELFAKNHEIAVLWRERMTQSISELDTSDFMERWTGNSMTITPEVGL